ncbi:hypothetical protein BJX70DRAFT_407222 [Aspergillus crustosus]
MKLSILSLLTLTSLSTATPAAVPVPAPIPQDPRQTTAPTILYPHRTYRTWISTGTIKEDPQDQLLVVKDSNPLNESSALTTFSIPPDTAGLRCLLVIDLWDRDHSTGSQTVDVFTSIEPGRRDRHVGRVFLPRPGRGMWVGVYGWEEEFECPAGEVIGFEFVGVGERVEVRWDIGVTGPLVYVLET